MSSADVEGPSIGGRLRRQALWGGGAILILFGAAGAWLVAGQWEGTRDTAQMHEHGGMPPGRPTPMEMSQPKAAAPDLTIYMVYLVGSKDEARTLLHSLGMEAMEMDDGSMLCDDPGMQVLVVGSAEDEARALKTLDEVDRARQRAGLPPVERRDLRQS